MADFLDEVKNEINSEKYEQFFLKNGSKLVALAIAALVFTGAYSFYVKQQHKKALATGTLFIDAFADSKPEKYDGVITKEQKGFSPLASFAKAGLLASSEKYEDSAKVLQGISGNNLYDEAFRQKAMIDEAYVMIKQKADMSAIMNKLDVPTAKGAPFRASALDLKASYLLEQGDKKAAKAIYTELANDAQVAATLQDRAKHMLTVIGD